jgi:hypothetical protein
MKKDVSVMDLIPQNSYIEVLTCSTSECDFGDRAFKRGD